VARERRGVQRAGWPSAGLGAVAALAGGCARGGGREAAGHWQGGGHARHGVGLVHELLEGKEQAKHELTVLVREVLERGNGAVPLSVVDARARAVKNVQVHNHGGLGGGAGRRGKKGELGSAQLAMSFKRQGRALRCCWADRVRLTGSQKSDYVCSLQIFETHVIYFPRALLG
jgi:hypothetical protein